MKVVMLYHPNSEHARTVESYAHDYSRLKSGSQEINLVSLETLEGSDMAKLYDITSYPALLVLSNDNQLQKLWQDEHLPLMNELDAYVQAAA